MNPLWILAGLGGAAVALVHRNPGDPENLRRVKPGECVKIFFRFDPPLPVSEHRGFVEGYASAMRASGNTVHTVVVDPEGRGAVIRVTYKRGATLRIGKLHADENRNDSIQDVQPCEDFPNA